VIEHQGDLFKEVFTADHRIAISTNGFVKKNGRAVMGRGCAKDAVIMYPEFPEVLGAHIRINGNKPGYVTVGAKQEPRTFMILPVKHAWWERASLELIEMSVDFLFHEAIAHPEITFHVPRLGCGNGRLDWLTQVRPRMVHVSNNVVVHH
jgi:hypothetical protein